MNAKMVWFVMVVLCVLGLAARAEVIVTTADGNGADTYLTNDGQQGPDTVTGGEDRIRAFRAFEGVRMKIGYIRFDLSGVAGDPNSAILTFDATWLKGGEKVVDVYGMNEGPGEFWDEGTITYNTAPGFIPNPPTELGYYGFEEGAFTQLGTLTTPAVPDPAVYPVTFSSTLAALPLEDFLAMDTNGVVTLVFIGTDNEAEVASKERDDPAFSPPRITLPNAVAVTRASEPSPPNLEKVVVGEYAELSWVNPEPNLPGGVVTCDVYFGTSEPNALLPNYGLSLLAEGITGNSVAMPALDVYTTYYWVVDTHDTSREPEYVQGKVWSFNTNNSAPEVNAGEDQYVWLTGGVIVDTGSSNDTYMRDATDRGGMEYMDVRNGGTWGFGGYLQFDLSELAALPADQVMNATLTLKKVPGSRNDGISNERFAVQGLLPVAGNTPQNWDEHLLNTDTVGDEWTWPLDLGSGRLLDLDEDAADITEVIANDVVTITGADLDAFLQSRIEDDGMVTFVLTCEVSGKGFGIASKENSTPEYRPRLQLNYGMPAAAVTLSGSYVDDGLPAGGETLEWTEVSRPEGAEATVIDPADQLLTTVTLDTVGFYEFQLAVDDGDLVGTDTVQVYVGYDPCDAAQNMPDYEVNIADLNTDCFVDLGDVAIMAAQWLDCTSLECP